jgi:hypothetical protein
MEKSAKRLRDQMNLPLFDLIVSPSVPADKRKELNRALMELLLHVAQEKSRMPSEGGEHDEPTQAHA